ncbi:MAG: hypothetical protein C0392_03565 [Syntrophus sp. (in: bacteria)]|nr:hypothetical protein [Syntrophus sp. (in: bacteria)]
MKILVFAPHSAIWIHAFPEALVAEAIVQQGNEMIYIGCGGVLDAYCISMSAYGIPFEAKNSSKKRICRICKRNKEIIRSRFGFAGVDLKDVVTGDDVSYANEIADGVTQANFLDLILDDVEVGRIALYELLVDAKKSTFDFSLDEWKRYQASLKNAVVVLRGAQRIINEARPDRVIVYNTLYSVNHIVTRIAELRGIPHYMIHGGGNFSKPVGTLLLFRGDGFRLRKNMLEKWKEVGGRPCASNIMKLVTDHFLETIKGRNLWAYSSAATGYSIDLRKFFDIGDGQKIICATMSSYDEWFAADAVGRLCFNDTLIYPNQVDWIRSLIDFVSNRKDLFLIIRVHPREFPNKREGVLSEHAKMLKDILKTLPGNVRVNWPTDKVSLYDLAHITDVFANAWSSTGCLMASLGLPVVLYSNNIPTYPAELNYFAITEEEYFQQLEQALIDGWSAEWIRKTYRWLGMDLGYSMMDISESFSRNTYGERSICSMVVNKLISYIAPCREQEKDCRKRAPYLSVSAKIDKILKNELNSVLDLDEQDAFASHQEETDCLKKEVRRLFEGLYGNSDISSQKNSLAMKLWNYANL